MLCIKVKNYWSLKRSLDQSLKEGIFPASTKWGLQFYANSQCNGSCLVPTPWDISWCLDSSSILPTFMKTLLLLAKASTKCNCSLSESRICNHFLFSVPVTQVCDWSARIVNVVATMVLKSIVDVEMYYILNHYMNYVATTEIVSNY